MPGLIPCPILNASTIAIMRVERATALGIEFSTPRALIAVRTPARAPMQAVIKTIDKFAPLIVGWAFMTIANIPIRTLKAAVFIARRSGLMRLIAAITAAKTAIEPVIIMIDFLAFEAYLEASIRRPNILIRTVTATKA